MNIYRRTSELWNKLKEFLINLNFFQSKPPSTDEHELSNQRISTRLFIILFAISLVILLLYNSLKIDTKTVNIETPSFAQYTQLNSTYSKSLTCPCSKISINYKKFVSIEYTLHQVCTSIFVNQSWINYLGSHFATNFTYYDFRRTSQAVFQTLNALCDLIDTTISESLLRFYSNQYVSASVVRQKVFEKETQALIQQFQSTTITSFLLSLSTIRDTTQANSLLSGLQSNYKFWMATSRNYVRPDQIIYDECECGASSTCTSQSFIFHYPTKNNLFNVPGFLVGCYLIESLLQSTLECLYDQRCIHILQDSILSPLSIIAIALDSSLSNRSSPNSTVQDLVNNLMIEEWNAPPVYEKYYNECQPIQCIYTYETRNDILYIATALFGIAGGLTTVLKLILPRLINLLRKKREEQQQSPITRPQIRHLFQKVKEYVSTLNIFSSVRPSTDDHELCNQRIATRLFIIIFSVSLVILLLYTSLKTTTKTVHVETPSFDQYTQLNYLYSETLTCPCEKISIKYENLLDVEYTFHQVCWSIFVEESWIKNITLKTVSEILLIQDFKLTASSVFQALRTFCHLLNKTISDSLIRFNSNQYVSASVVRQEVFESETEALVDQFLLSMKNRFFSSLSLIRGTTQANAFWSAYRTNYDLQSLTTHIVLMREVKYGNCSCALSSNCIMQSSIYDVESEELILDIPGFKVGCLVTEFLLQSTLECFYNQQCIDKIIKYRYFSSSISVQPLDLSLFSQYSPNSTVQDLVNNLMIEEWNATPTYERYYNECQPIQCIYTYETRNDLIYIVTTLFGIAGGLTTVLKMILPRLIKLLRKKKEEQQPSTEMINGQRIAILWRKMKDYIQNLNLFPSVPPSTDEYQVRNQRISTLVFIFLLIISMIILLLYTSLIRVTKTVNVNEPSFVQYKQLDSSYSKFLICPCTNISIDYDKFFHIEYTLHQICSSIFVDQNWIDHLPLPDEIRLLDTDFRWTSRFTFQGLKTFCDMSNQTIVDELNRFYSNKYISATIVRQQSFQSETEELIQQFRSSTIDQFLLFLSMIRKTTQANALFSVLQNSYKVVPPSFFGYVWMMPQTYGDCSCASSSQCVRPIYVFTNNDSTNNFSVPDFYVGCYVIEALLQSSLKCFYNQQCINKLELDFTSPPPMFTPALNESLPSEYFPNSTVEEIVNNLMIDYWNASPIYERYYNECQPKQCTYKFQTRNDLIYIATTLFGIAGGLTTVLETIVPRFIDLVASFIRNRRAAVAPDPN